MSDDTTRENFIRSVIDHCEHLGQNGIPSQVEGLATHYAPNIGDSCCFYHGIMALTLAASHLTREVAKDLGLDLTERKSDEKIMEQLDCVFSGLKNYHMSMIEAAHLLLIATFLVLHDVGKGVETNCPPSGICEE
jgi:hypothetical protein